MPSNPGSGLKLSLHPFATCFLHNSAKFGSFGHLWNFNSFTWDLTTSKLGNHLLLSQNPTQQRACFGMVDASPLVWPRALPSGFAPLQNGVGNLGSVYCLDFSSFIHEDTNIKSSDDGASPGCHPPNLPGEMSFICFFVSWFAVSFSWPKNVLTPSNTRFPLNLCLVLNPAWQGKV